MRGLIHGLLAAGVLLGIPGTVLAAEGAPAVDTGDTAWVLISAALVMLMTPGLAFFYGGMVRSKNVLTTIMQSFFIVAMVSVQWVLFGFSLAFGPDINGVIGSLSWAGLTDMALFAAPYEDYSATVPLFAFAAFQCMFAVITAALITGAYAERFKFGAFVLFTFLWTTFLYDPMAHWVWGVGGWLRDLGALDFAGGTVIHILSGVSGLVACIMLGKRSGKGVVPMLPHHLPMTVLGAALLWFGWFGFNAGSALGANGLAAGAFVVTQAAAAAATLSWVGAEWLVNGHPTMLGAASGCIAGLVAITPAAGFVTVVPAVLIGLIGGVLCFAAVAIVKAKLGYDDALDAFGVHGVGGTWGALATGLWATKTANSAGADGLFYGNAHQLYVQAVTVGVAIVLAVVGTYIILKIVGAVTTLRADAAEEESGLDIVEHGERAYRQSIINGTPLTNLAVQEAPAFTAKPAPAGK